jgi:hypothetical protein
MNIKDDGMFKQIEIEYKKKEERLEQEKKEIEKE